MEAGDVTIANPGDLTGLLEDRGITLDDIKAVIAAAESSGIKYQRVDDETRFLARHLLGKFSVYAEYSAGEDAYKVHTVYCHRVKFVSEDKEQAT